MAKDKTPSIIKKIRAYKPNDINYSFQKSISYSQMSMYLSCPKKWALQYKEHKRIYSPSINMSFGTAIHETVQHYIHTIYEKTGVEADNIDLEKYFETRFREIYLEEVKKNKNTHFSTSAEMHEFYEDGINILEFIKKKRNEYFTKRGWWLVGIEMPLVINSNKRFKNVLFSGYIDLVLYNENTNSFVIYDIKTSRQGWKNKEKKDEIKQFQILLYKSYFSEQFGVDKDKIDIKFFILKRKIWENSEFVQRRIQEFSPPSGKIKIKKAHTALDKFIEEVFTEDGEFKNTEHKATPSKDACKYCAYFKTEFCLDGVSK